MSSRKRPRLLDDSFDAASVRRLEGPPAFLRSLRTLCVELVARNLEALDSLVNVPEAIGKEIFDAAVRLGAFDFRHGRLLVDRFRPFAERYEGRLLLTRLSARRNSQIVEGWCWRTLSLTKPEHNLTHLNLNHCGLGQYHPIIPHIGRMDHLMYLGMADNGLSNASIRKLTVNARMTGRGPSRLRHLDLSCNYSIDRNSLHYLNKTFRQLDNLNLARTGVPVREVNPPVIHGISRQEPVDMPPPRPRPVPVHEPVPVRTPRRPIEEDGGWVKPMVHVWDEHTKEIEAHTHSPQASPVPAAPERARSPRPRDPQEEVRGWVAPMVDHYQDPDDARKFEERTLTLYFRRPPPDVAIDTTTGKFLPKREYNEIIANESRGVAADRMQRRVEFSDQAPVQRGGHMSETTTTTTVSGNRKSPARTTLPSIWSN